MLYVCSSDNWIYKLISIACFWPNYQWNEYINDIVNSETPVEIRTIKLNENNKVFIISVTAESSKSNNNIEARHG